MNLYAAVKAPTHHELNDPLDDIFGRVGTPEEREAARPTPAPEKIPATHFEKCPKCGGTGRYRGASRHGSQCFACKGAGGRHFKGTAEKRAKARTQAAAWLAASPSDFAASLRGSLEQWGTLTDNQLAAVHRSIEKDAARRAEAEARAAAAPTADEAGVNRLKEAFDHAIQYARERGRGLKQPRITIGAMVISPASATSANPGALYVKASGQYLGKVVAGKFHRSRECTDEQQARVLAFIADPKAAAVAYGLETGVCCVCNAELTNKESVERGIGPICAEKFGW